MKRMNAFLPLLALLAALCGCSFDGAGTNIDGLSPTIYNYVSMQAVTEPPAEETDAPAETTTVVTGPVQVSIEDRAEEILSSMSADEKIGQLILAAADTEDVSAQIEQYHLGGVTFYAADFENSDPDTFRTMCDRINSKSKIKPFFAVDEEGGDVTHVSKFSAFRSSRFKSPQDIYKNGGLDALKEDTAEKAQLLRSLGINLNLAPVCDISDDKYSYIYPRTMGTGADEAASGISTIVKTAGENGVASCLKHFPGYGDNTDTHTGAAHDSRDLYEFYNRDFVTFQAGLDASEDKTPAVMVGHTVYDAIDEGVPASLSKVVHGVLRKRLRFNGVAVTDDLSMDALKEYTGDTSVYVAAIKADNDLICCSDAKRAYQDLRSAYYAETITTAELNAHVKRILIMKLEHGIIS